MQPCADRVAVKNYHRTIEGSISLDDIKQFIPLRVLSDLKSIYPDKYVKIWGVTPSEDPSRKNSKQNIWNDIEPGDIALMAKKGKYFARAIVTYKLNNYDLAEYLWGTTDNGNAWEYIYFVDQVSPIDIAYEDFNKVVSYKEKKVPQGFTMLSKEQSDVFLLKYNFIGNINSSNPLMDQINNKINFNPDSDLDVERIIKSRAEQKKLRDFLFKHDTEKCIICGKEYVRGMMVAAHIKKRADCSDEEKRDLNNIAAPMCKFGCDELYEKGYIGISDKGIVTDLKNQPTTDAIVEHLASIENNICTKWNDCTKGYFKYHYDKHAPK